MTLPVRPRSPTRRQVLAGTLLLALAACANSSATDGTAAPADSALRRQAAADEQRLLAAYAATASRHPELAATLAVPWQHHREHAARLGVAAGVASPGPTTPGTSTAPSAPPAPSAPASGTAALGALAALERSVAATRREACAAAGRGLAPLLGSLAAAELVHADVLLAGGGT